jgi:simple sugar transport system substrate-binding protein
MKGILNKKFLFLLSVILISLFLTGMVSAQEYEIVHVYKIAGIPFGNVEESGVVQAGEELNVNSYQIAPTEPDPAQQVRMIEDLIAKGVDAICVTPNDPSALEPVLLKAQKKGIVVVTNEAVGQKGADWDIETVDPKVWGANSFEKFAALMNGEGEFALFVGGLEVQFHNDWADAALVVQKEKYPNMKLVTNRIPCAEALKAKNMAGEIIVVGSVMPEQSAPYLKAGLIQTGSMMDPKKLGYSMVYVAKLLLDGEEIKDGMEIPGLGAAVVDFEEKTIRLHGVLNITAENADKLGF